MSDELMESLWRTHYPRLCVYVRSSFPTLREEAGDLAQETFVRAYAARDRISVNGPPAPWLYAIARNLCLDRLRRLAVRKRMGNEELPSDAVEVGGTDACENLERERLRRAVMTAMESLKPQDREICFFHYFEELSIEEISSLVGRPAGTIKYRLYRIRTGLKKRLEAHHAR